MDLSSPYVAVAPTLDGEILVTLARTSRPLTGRQVSRLVRRGSQSGVNRTLGRLVEQGLVLRQEAGRAMLFTLNREHLAVAAVEQLASLREELLNRIKATCGAWALPARHVSVFGSAARGDGGPQSDVDLFIVRPRATDADDPRWREQIEQLARHVRRWSGNVAGISEISERELARLHRQKPAIVAELKKDAITLIGAPVARLLGRAR